MRIFLLIYSLFIVLTGYGQMVADAGNDTSICAGESVRLGGNPTVAGGLAPYNYTWTPTTGLSNPSIANPTATPLVTTEYKVDISDANGRSIRDSLTITVLAATNVVINDSTACDNAGSIPLIHGFPTGGKYSGPGISDSLNMDVNAAGLGVHQIIYHFIDTNCGVKLKDTAFIEVFPAPQISINTASDTICEGDTVTLEVVQLDTVTTTYLWGPGPFTGSDTSATVKSVPDTSTNYTLVATNVHGCVEQTSRMISVQECVGIAEQNVRVKPLNVFPNPSDGEFTVTWDHKIGVNMEAVDMAGKVIEVLRIENGMNSFNKQNWEGGMYILRILFKEDVVFIGEILIE